MESDHDKYKGKCKKFENSCRSLIRIMLQHQRSIWEVRQYNGPYTCLATSISNYHKKLDYHVISAFIFSMIRADMTVSIKILQNATEAHFGFRPTYQRMWLAKQKVVAHIYGDWEEAYNKLPRWVLDVKITMPNGIAVLRTSLVRVRGQDDVAIAQDGNSNIVPIAFALVEGENIESRSFFLSHVLQQMTPHLGIFVISDRHKGIKTALEAHVGGWNPPAAYRAFCIMHVAVNFELSFKG
ncbi:uncharacterized protein [Arachis hypogaea]|uniref:uncharacterized protein n=1 Tax=Arachis hypogaea TaxID=3818 RepID=UPI003B2250FB